MNLNVATAEKKALVNPVKSLLVQNVGLLAFGVFIIFAVGFFPTEAAHNAAHDTRHALAFPCH